MAVQTSRSKMAPSVASHGGLGIGAWEWDVLAQKVHCSPELNEIYGGAEPEPTVDAFLAFIHPDDRAQATAVVGETLATRRERHEHRFRIVRPDGEVRHILSRARLIRDDGGRPVKLAGIDVDLGAEPAGRRPRIGPFVPADDPARDPLEDLWAEIEDRFGVCPSFFKLSRNDPPTARMLWRLAQYAYLDFAAPSLFKEQLFTCLSRFCQVRYCVARHAGFLMGLGRPAADPTASTLTAEEVVALLEQSLPQAPELPEALAALEAVPAPLAQWPELGSQAGRRIRIACEAVFLDPAGARPWLAALHRLLGAQRYEQLMLFLAFVRMANFWTELHPELQLEGDLQRLLEEHEALAQVLRPGPQGAADGLAARVREETTALAEQQKLIEQLRLITDALHALVAYIDRDQRYIFVNAGYAGAFDLAPGMIIGRTVLDVIGRDLYGKASPHLAAALGGQGVQRYEFALETSNGQQEVINQVTIVPHQRSDGCVIGCTVLVVDITERKVAEAALRQSEGGFRTLSEAAPAMVWACRADGFLFHLNQRWVEYTGQNLEQYRGYGWTETIHPDDRPQILAQWEQCRLAGEIFEGEVRFRRSDGQYRWHYFRSVPLRAEDGVITTWYGVGLDIQGKKAAEQALRESEARFREMADNAPMMVWVSDPNGQCTFLSRTWYEFTDQSPRTGLGMRWLDAVHPDDRERVRRTYLAANARHEGYRIEYRLRRADGEYRWAIDAAAPRLDQDDAFLGFIGSVIDISERKEAEDRQALLMREVDHRARNALAVVQSVVRLTRADDPASFVATVEGRIGAIAYAHTLLAESGWTRASLRSLLERELAPHGVERIQLSGEDVVLGPEFAQPFALAIHELVTNAVKYGALSSASGRVEVVWKLDPPAGGVRITWRESGGPPVQPPARQSFGSTLIARALEDQLGGSARQRWHPQGLVCELVIPVERLRGPAGAPSRSEPQTGTVRVLVIEDDMLIALDVAEMLREFGHQVIGPVGRMSDALEIIERESVDAAVLDANLGGESAAPIAKRLRTLAIPFVVATGYAQVPDFGAADETLVLTKPIAAQDLRGALRALLAGAVA